MPAVRLKSIKDIVANAVTTENVLRFREEHVFNITPQFVPNVFQGVDVLEKAKFRRIIITLDSEDSLFGAPGAEVNYFVAAINVAVATTIIASFYIADNSGDYEKWTYTISKSWVEKKEYGRIEDGVRRNTFEYHVVMYGTKLIETVNV